MEEAQAEIFTQFVLEINYVVEVARGSLVAGRQRYYPARKETVTMSGLYNDV